MTKQELLEKHETILDNVEAMQVLAERLNVLSEVVFDICACSCSLDTKNKELYANAYTFVRNQPRLSVMNILMGEHIQQLSELLDTVCDIACELRFSSDDNNDGNNQIGA